jgi:hypothetical protein
MNKKQKEEFIELFSQSFKEVVLPSLEDMQTDINELKETTYRIEERLEKHDNHLERHDTKLDNHEKRISKLETS